MYACLQSVTTFCTHTKQQIGEGRMHSQNYQAMHAGGSERPGIFNAIKELLPLAAIGFFIVFYAKPSIRLRHPLPLLQQAQHALW